VADKGTAKKDPETSTLKKKGRHGSRRGTRGTNEKLLWAEKKAEKPKRNRAAKRLEALMIRAKVGGEKPDILKKRVGDRRVGIVRERQGWLGLNVTQCMGVGWKGKANVGVTTPKETSPLT